MYYGTCPPVVFMSAFADRLRANGMVAGASPSFMEKGADDIHALRIL